MTRTILVTGARGKTGREVIRHLRDRTDVTVRAGSSKPDREQIPSAEPVAFDWHDPATWRKAVDGIDAIYLMRPDIPDAPELVADLVDHIPHAHVVLLSEQGAGELTADHWTRRVEDAVATRATTWTLLRPSWFHQVLTDARFYRDGIRREHVLSLPSGGGSIAWVDARDIAAVAVAALRSPAEHHGRAHTLTGPAALPVAAVAATLSAHLGYPVRADDPPRQQALHGLDRWTAGILDDIYDRVRHDGFAALSTAVEAITGSPPISMTGFIEEHVDQWRT